MTNLGKFCERNPCIKAAGKQYAVPEESTATCLEYPITEDDYCRLISKELPLNYKPPPKTTNCYQGINTEVRKCLQPDVDKGFYDILTREFQETVYDSYWNREVGRVKDPTPFLPAGMNPMETCFGKPTETNIESASDLINPKKSFVCVDAEGHVGHDMYKMTHQDYDPGEQIRRMYAEPFDRNKIWGKSTPNDPLGRCMKKVMSISSDDKLMISKDLADYRKRSLPMIGKVLAPNNNLIKVPKGHAFGKLMKRELYGTAELLRDCPYPPNLDKIDLLEQLSHINTLRGRVVKRKPPFQHREFVDSFHMLDDGNTGCISLNDAYKVMADFHIFPEKPLFEALLNRLQILSNNGFVSYEKLTDLLNVNVLFPDISKIADLPNECLHFVTTNQLAHAYHSDPCIKVQNNFRPAGLKQGESISMKSILNPSIFSQYFLQPKDFFISRSQEYIRTLFCNLGVDLDQDTFCMVWNTAKDSKGCVCVQSFIDSLKTRKLF